MCFSEFNLYRYTVEARHAHWWWGSMYTGKDCYKP
jgi:hypothetical protein